MHSEPRISQTRAEIIQHLLMEKFKEPKEQQALYHLKREQREMEVSGSDMVLSANYSKPWETEQASLVVYPLVSRIGISQTFIFHP